VIRKIVEYTGVKEGGRRDNPTGMFTYDFCPKDQVLGIPTDGRRVAVVEDPKALEFFLKRPDTYAVAEDLEQELQMAEFMVVFKNPEAAEALAQTLEGLGFTRRKKAAKE